MTTIYREVEVEVDLDDLIEDLSAEDLRKAGLIRVAPSDDAGGNGQMSANIAHAIHGSPDKPLQDQWLAVREHLRRGNVESMLDVLNVMAWNQAGVMLPITAKLSAVA